MQYYVAVDTMFSGVFLECLVAKVEMRIFSFNRAKEPQEKLA